MENFKQIDIDEAHTMINKGNVTIVDIRDQESYEAAHIKNALTVNDKNVESFIRGTDKNKPLICYCYHGFSSQSAAEYFKQNGFKEVYSVEGGFEKWKAVYPFVSIRDPLK